MKKLLAMVIGFGLLLDLASPAFAQGAAKTDSQKTQEPAAATEHDGDALVKKVQNPLSDLISIPFQDNIDFGVGPRDRVRNTLNIQPVVPFRITDNWNLLTRTIFPVVTMPKLDTENDSVTGLGDISQNLFLSPSKPGKLIGGAGAALLFPTATDQSLGSGKWGIGPSVALISQPKPWTFGVIANNIWSVAGDEDRADVNLMTLQYLIVYNLPGQWNINSSPIIYANWEADSGDQWLVPFGGGFGKLSWIRGKLPVSWSVSAYWNGIHPENIPYPDWTLRLQVGLLFPK